MNKFAKALKQITSKRVRTDADILEMARIEFLAGLYMSESGPVLPAQLIDAALINGAKKSKEGVSAKSGLFCPEHAPLEYDGPRTADELWEDDRFRHSALVKVGMARVVRTRPIFESWTATVKINVEESVVNPSRVDDWIVTTGSIVGLGDWRPRYGRYEATRLT